MNRVTADEMRAVAQSRVMSIDFLFDDFDRLIQSPESVHRLRRFILDLAVRGKLVPQDPNDEPASELLKRITAEKARLVKAGEIITKAPDPSGKPVEQDFLTPANWTIAKLADISNIVMGQSPQGETYNTYREGVPLINGPVEFSEGPFGKTVINQYTTAPTNFCNKGDFLICVRGSTTGRTNIAGFGACIGRGVAAIQPVFDDDFVRFFLWSMRKRIISMGRGAAFPSITRKQLETLPVPVPPLAEQHRIVAKVDELMALCDRLEAARAERELTRDRLASASLSRLNTPDHDPATFQKHSAFALNNLDPLTTRPDQIKVLRQTILNLAVRGKLAPQDPNDEPASELLKRIALEKARLVKARKTRKQVRFPSPDASEVSFDLPSSWAWCPSTYPTYIVSDKGKKIQTKDVVETGKFPVVDQGKVLIRGFHNDANKVIRIKEPIVLFGDHTREVKLIDFDFVVGADGVKLLQPVSLHTPYYFLALQWLPLKSRGYGRHFKLLKASFIPLPPLAEQRRIVSKVDELMGLCDRLEVGLSTGEETRGRLFESVLYEALEPGGEMAIKY